MMYVREFSVVALFVFSSFANAQIKKDSGSSSAHGATFYAPYEAKSRSSGASEKIFPVGTFAEWEQRIESKGETKNYVLRSEVVAYDSKKKEYKVRGRLWEISSLGERILVSDDISFKEDINSSPDEIHPKKDMIEGCPKKTGKIGTIKIGNRSIKTCTLSLEDDDVISGNGSFANVPFGNVRMEILHGNHVKQVIQMTDFSSFD